MKNVLFIGADAPYARRMVKDLMDKGLTVYAGVKDRKALEGLDGVKGVEMDPTLDGDLERAAQEIGAIDMLILNYQGDYDAGAFPQGLDYSVILEAFSYQTLGPLHALKAFLPKLYAGEGKRIVYVTSPLSSNNLTFDGDDFAAHMSLAPVNMQVKTLFNQLRPKGFTFRLYCRDIKNPDGSGDAYAAEYFTRDQSYADDEPYQHNDENRLVLRDHLGRELPW